jgi:formamidopyrimidine-DNA glycosylase
VPELPDVTVYIEALERRIAGERLEQIRLNSPFLLRTVAPPIESVRGATVRELRRVGKRIVIGFDPDLWVVLHLMIAGRLHWHAASEPPATKTGRAGKRAAASLVKLASPASSLGKQVLAAFDFTAGRLTLTEAGSKKRASLHIAQGEAGLLALDAGGIEPLDCSLEEFTTALTSSNHTLKRALTDPHLFSGIGNAYSDEILHRARLSPIALTQKLTPDQIQRLFDATQATLFDWTARLRAEAGDGFPEKVTAFRKGMAVHGRYREPCPVCATPVQRIRYAENETNYCPRCQTGGKLLADRALSRLLREDWPRSLDELENLKSRG